MYSWVNLINSIEYKQLQDLPGECWKDVSDYEGLYQLSNYGRLRSKDRVRLQNHISGKMIEHQYKGKLISIDYSTSKFGCAYLYDVNCKSTLNIYEGVCKLFGQVAADKFFYDTDYIEVLDGEVWADIVDWPNYQVSTAGRVRRLMPSYKIILKPWLVADYYAVRLSNINITRDVHIHRLVAETFIPNLENKLQVNHKDEDKLNNTLCNLEWVTPSENMQHAYHTGLISYDPDIKRIHLAEGNKKLQVGLYCKQLNTYFRSIAQASRELHLSYDKIREASLHGTTLNNYTFERWSES